MEQVRMLFVGLALLLVLGCADVRDTADLDDSDTEEVATEAEELIDELSEMSAREESRDVQLVESADLGLELDLDTGSEVDYEPDSAEAEIEEQLDRIEEREETAVEVN